jgi:hypothetical protein
MMWPTDIINIGQVMDEGVPIEIEVNTRLPRVCGLVSRQRVPLTL